MGGQRRQDDAVRGVGGGEGGRSGGGREVEMCEKVQ